MTTDTQIAELANSLILDMYQSHKRGVFKGYINWFAASYQRAVEARRQKDSVLNTNYLRDGRVEFDYKKHR